MDVQHINVKFYIENAGSVNVPDFYPVFNAWTQTQRLDDLLVDVADYLHVHNGPGMLLIGHQADYSLDNRAGRLGLLYNRKEPVEGTTQDKLAQAVRAALTVALILQNENGLKFNGQEVQLIINDRLIAPNNTKTFGALEPDLKIFFNKLFNGAEYTLTNIAEPRERFTVNVTASKNFDLETLLKNLSAQEAEHA
jgi:hypothetical protein